MINILAVYLAIFMILSFVLATDKTCEFNWSYLKHWSEISWPSTWTKQAQTRIVINKFDPMSVLWWSQLIKRTTDSWIMIVINGKIHMIIIRANQVCWTLQAVLSWIMRIMMPKSWSGLGSIQFRNWNCSSIPIPIPELELKLVELKMELELKSLELELELELKTGIEFFATATAALTSWPTIFKF